jgi:hypothetical protein
MNSWDDVLAFARTLPDVEITPFYGVPCPKVNGKGFVAPGREPGSFCLFTSSIDEKRMLIETDPQTFWDTAHYRNYPSVLVRYGSDARDRVETYIKRSWWDRAKKAQRQAFGERP